MKAFTRERLTKILIETMALIKERSSRTGDSSGISTEVNAELFAEVTRIALASLTAEPVAWECGENIILFNPDTVEAYAKRAEISPKPLYTAPPAPVVPATLPCAVELKPGLIIGKGCKTETLLTTLRRRADYYAKIDAMTPEERAEHDVSIEAFKAMLPPPCRRGMIMVKNTFDPPMRTTVASGEDYANSPVIPEGYALVPKEPTRQMMAQGHFAMKGTDRGKFRRIYQAMIDAAPAFNKGEH